MPDSPAALDINTRDRLAAVNRAAGMRQRLAAIGIRATLTLTAVAVGVGMAFVTSTGGGTLPTHPSMLSPVAPPVAGRRGALYCHWRPYGWFCPAGPAGANRLTDPLGVKVGP
jgi:hypothetical protein